MLVGGYKQDPAWKTRTYPVPMPSRSGFRWKASALRSLDRFAHGTASSDPATIMVPALYNFMPAETLAMGWLNEIDALVTIRQRIIAASKITGWDVFTFHTLYNADHFFDTTIGAIRDTWMKEGNLSTTAHLETKRPVRQAIRLPSDSRPADRKSRVSVLLAGLGGASCLWPAAPLARDRHRVAFRARFFGFDFFRQGSRFDPGEVWLALGCSRSVAR